MSTSRELLWQTGRCFLYANNKRAVFSLGCVFILTALHVLLSRLNKLLKEERRLREAAESQTKQAHNKALADQSRILGNVSLLLKETKEAVELEMRAEIEIVESKVTHK